MIVLDTHAVVWWVNGDAALSVSAEEAIVRERHQGGRVLISSISAWEIAMLIQKGRLVLTMDVEDWLATVAAVARVEFVPVDNALAVQSVRLPGAFHGDPADRLITALARHHGVPLVTADEGTRAYQHVQTIW